MDISALHRESKQTFQVLAPGDFVHTATPTSWLHLGGQQIFLDILRVLQIIGEACWVGVAEGFEVGWS